MRSYLIEEISTQDMSRIIEAVTLKAYKTPMENLFWIILPKELLTLEQKEHSDQCGPHYLALETGEDWVKLELLIRCERKIRCDCISYANPEQREYMIDFLDQTIRNQDVRV
ncbi:MAG: hypothetical protein ABR542_04065 [Desulfonatronovibrio sp.]